MRNPVARGLWLHDENRSCYLDFQTADCSHVHMADAHHSLSICSLCCGASTWYGTWRCGRAGPLLSRAVPSCALEISLRRKKLRSPRPAFLLLTHGASAAFARPSTPSSYSGHLGAVVVFAPFCYIATTLRFPACVLGLPHSEVHQRPSLTRLHRYPCGMWPGLLPS